MNKTSIVKRIEAIEERTSENNGVALYVEHPDGRVDGDPVLVAKAGKVLRWVIVQPAPGGGPMTEEALEAKYPGRRGRLDAWERAVEAARHR
jgi:hypothetical protein